MKFNLIYFIRLFLRHIVLIAAVPLVMAVTVTLLTKGEPRNYMSQTTVYTSLATGSSIDLSNFLVSTVNSQFDNLMSIIKSRETLEKTGLSLLASHLLLDKPDPLIIQEEHYLQVMKSIPDEVRKLKVPGDFEKTLANLQQYMNSSVNNPVYNLVKNSYSYYNAGTILSKLRVRRIQNSDNIELSYESDDPGVCQHTLMYLVSVYRESYQFQKAGQEDKAVAYFEGEVARSAERLKAAEDDFLEFLQKNQIINYNEQSKFIAARKEAFETGYQEVLKQNAAADAVIDLLEGKMTPEEKRRLTSSELLELRARLSKVSQDLAMESNNVLEGKKEVDPGREAALRQQSSDLQEQMRLVVDSLYQFTHGNTAVPTGNIVSDWLGAVIQYEGTNAQIITLDRLRDDFIKIYAQYAPMGAMMRRLERKINVEEDEYISLVKNLGLAKLKQQSVEASSANTILDPPYYPLHPLPDKRKMTILAAAVAGLGLILFLILAIDLMDSSMRNAAKAKSETGLEVESIFPVIGRNRQKVDIAFLEKKSIEAITRKLMLHSLSGKRENAPLTCIAFSTRDHEGKSFLLQRIAAELGRIGHKVLVLHPDEGVLEGQTDFDIARYEVSDDFYRISSLRKLEIPGFTPAWETYNFIFAEFPGILHSSFPVNLFKAADHCFLVCRANRSWSKADANILAEVLAVTDPVKPRVLLNGVAVEEMESIVGDLPRKRSWIRKLVKRIVTRQFKASIIR